MTMATLQLYMNPHHYPHYSETIQTYGPLMECTPVGWGLQGGELRVKGTTLDFTHANYLCLEREGQKLYAWITDAKFLTENSFTITYKVDAWRTYKHQVELGVQYIARGPMGTTTVPPKLDPLLTSRDPRNEISTKMFAIGDPTIRVFVVQVRTKSGELFSRSPVNPTPYAFYMVEYPVNGWTSCKPIDDLMTRLRGAEPENIVTMYSIPYMDLSTLNEAQLPVITANETNHVDGFKKLSNSDDPSALLSIKAPIEFDYPVDQLFYEPHSVQLVVPEAGVMNIPDDIITKPGLALRQDVDLFSGASNYMLVTGEAAVTPYTFSVRGSAISSIPIVSDPFDTYMSQNQNALATSLIGDVAMIAGGIAMTAGLPGIGAAMGGASAMTGVTNIIQRQVQLSEAASNYSNPPAFLGTALATRYSQRFWVVTTRLGATNHDIVHENYGYRYDVVAPLSFPSKGFIQTEGCTVRSKPGWGVPIWALEEINSTFNSGILVHA